MMRYIFKGLVLFQDKLNVLPLHVFMFQFICVAHLKKTGVDPKCFPVKADRLKSDSIQVYKRNNA